LHTFGERDVKTVEEYPDLPAGICQNLVRKREQMLDRDKSSK
jgi:hypothetical protein